jgi:hypothetical protein
MKIKAKLFWRTRDILFILSCFVIFINGSGVANGNDETGKDDFGESIFRQSIDEIKKAIVFFGNINDKGKPQFIATGFLVQMEKVFCLVTAKHVVVETKTGKPKEEDIRIFFNSQDGGITSRSIQELRKKYNLNWIFHPTDEAVDVAIIPFGLDLQKDDIKLIPAELFLPFDRLFETLDVIFLSYQPGIEPQRRISPIVRGGIISTLNADRTFYIDAFAFPGNSGSPVFAKQSLIRTGGNKIIFGGTPFKFAGIIGESITYQEIAVSTQTGRPRVVFEENTGLSKVWSIDYIRDIMGSEGFRQQLIRVRDKQ